MGTYDIEDADNVEGAPADPLDLDSVALSEIATCLRTQGLSPRIIEGSVILGRVGEADLICHCRVYPPSPNVNHAIVPVSFEVAGSAMTCLSSAASPPIADSESGSPVVAPARRWVFRDTVIGLSSDRTAGVVQATHTWCDGVFPPIRSAFALCSAPDDPYVHRVPLVVQDLETGDPLEWDLFVGSAQVGGSDSGPFAAFVGQSRIVQLLWNALATAATIPDLHGIKVYVAIQPNGELIVESKIDTIDWPEAVDILRRVNWPRVEGFVHYHQFLTMRPTIPARIPPPAASIERAWNPAKTTRPSFRNPGWWPFRKRNRGF